MANRAVVVANGVMQPGARLRALWNDANLRLAADGGARSARLFLHRAPDVVIGDMDSLDDDTRAWLETNHVELVRFPPAKDQTDLELALDLARTRGAGDLIVLGALGGRVDQSVGNILLLSRLPGVRLMDRGGEVWVPPTTTATIVGHAGELVSLIPLDAAVEGIVTDGLQYPLRAETLWRGSTRGISNVLLGDRAHVRWTRGQLLIAHLWDETENHS